MRLVALLILLVPLALLAALARAGPARAFDVRSVTVGASEDVSIPYWCSWGYDWRDRCWREDGARLPVGGVDDKVWRAALRFPLASVPPGALVLTAELELRYDGVCVGARRTLLPCGGRGYAFEARPVLTSRWSSERELDFGPAVAWAGLSEQPGPQWVVWDITDLVAGWVSSGVANEGVLLKLADGEEDFGTSGPAFPSSAFPDPAVRPRLTVWYLLE